MSISRDTAKTCCAQTSNRITEALTAQVWHTQPWVACLSPPHHPASRRCSSWYTCVLILRVHPCVTKRAGQLLPRMPPAHARAKGPPAPPSLPSTPYQFLSHGERIDRRVREINDKWSLGIKIRGFDYSPTKSSPNDIANKAYGHIQHLTYKDESALDHTIDEFNNRAWGKQPQERLNLLYELLSNAAKKCVTPSKTRVQDIGQSRSPVSSFRG